jgi:hypothetical protein
MDLTGYMIGMTLANLNRGLWQRAIIEFIDVYYRLPLGVVCGSKGKKRVAVGSSGISWLLPPQRKDSSRRSLSFPEATFFFQYSPQYPKPD